MNSTKLFLFLLLGLVSAEASAQSNLTSNNKSLAIFNPALHNYQYNKLTVSNSIFINPLSSSNNYTNFTSIVELNLKDILRFGVHASKAETRLNRYDSYKAYASYGFESETGNLFVLGAEFGYFSDQAKIAEFNKVWKPNHFTYTDSVATALDFGLGISFRSQGWTVGFGLNKLNRPDIIPFPKAIVELDTLVEGRVIIVDTSVVLGDDYKIRYGIQSNVNILYEWDINEKLSLLHSLHVTNPDFAGVDFIGFQTILRSAELFSAGFGFMNNGSNIYMLTGGITFAGLVTLEGSAFFMHDLQFQSNGDIYLDDEDGYESQGLKPMFEINLRIDL
jgi:hypothetical protein